MTLNWTNWMSLQQGQNLHSGKLIKIIKMLMDFLCTSVKLTDLQILGSDFHQNAFGGRLRPDPLGEI